MIGRTSAKDRYETLQYRRKPYLDRAREFANYTIPSLFPPEGFNSSSELYMTYQSLGAEGVNNLANHLMIAMYPPGMPSFKLSVPPEVLVKQGQLTLDADTEQLLSLSEGIVMNEIERKAWRFPTYLALQYLIISGNALEHMLPDNTIRLFRLDQFVVVRDGAGKEKEIVVKEAIHSSNLSERLKGLLPQLDNNESGTASPKYLYTWAIKKEDEWEIHQEFEGAEVPESRGLYSINPFKALRWNAVIGEDYGRGKVEDHFADLRSLDGLTKAVLDGSAMASRNIILVRPNAAAGINLKKSIAKSNNGEIISGNPEDIQFLQFTNTSGLQVTSQEIQKLEQKLRAAFLMNSSARRDAERVTAYELQIMTQELEGALGGVYSMLSAELQAHRIKRLIMQMQVLGQLPEWPEGLVEPTILTGLEALGREQDVNRVMQALQAIAGFPPDLLSYVKMETLLGKFFNGLGIPDAVRTEQEVQEMQQQQMQQQMMQQVAQAGGVAAAEQAATGNEGN